MSRAVVEEMIAQQQQKLLTVARKIIPHVTLEDLLQPQDYPELDFDPEFRYQEGVLYGLETVLIAIRATEK